ncbi:MAG: PilZ domain-containing protein [Chloroflexota bacterium]|nr:PilZ domain-containing protein [Chloroflexota bacterium]
MSVGGVQFESLIEILDGDNLLFNLQFPLPHLDESFETEIGIMGSNTSERARGIIRVYRCKFVNTPPRHSNEISRYLYEVQLDTRVGSPQRRRVREEPYPFEQGLAVLEIGRKVTLECVGPSGNEEKWPTVIQDIGDDGMLVMAPTYRGGPVAIDASKDIGIVIFNERTRALVVTRSRRLSVVREPIFMWRLGPPREFTRRHQRSHVRLPVNMDCTLHIFDSNQAPSVDDDFPVLVLDLSAGGAAFQSEERLPLGPDATVYLAFELTGSRTPFHVRVEVVGDIDERRVADRMIYRYKCQFMDMSIRREDEVTRYVFNEQAEARKRGMA